MFLCVFSLLCFFGSGLYSNIQNSSGYNRVKKVWLILNQIQQFLTSRNSKLILVFRQHFRHKFLADLPHLQILGLHDPMDRKCRHVYSSDLLDAQSTVGMQKCAHRIHSFVGFNRCWASIIGFSISSRPYLNTLCHLNCDLEILSSLKAS